jgi:hypothetical protein
LKHPIIESNIKSAIYTIITPPPIVTTIMALIRIVPASYTIAAGVAKTIAMLTTTLTVYTVAVYTVAIYTVTVYALAAYTFAVYTLIVCTIATSVVIACVTVSCGIVGSSDFRVDIVISGFFIMMRSTTRTYIVIC